MSGTVLCVGLCVVDLVHRVDRAPGPNEKVTARSRILTAGGPATNAALTVATLGGSAFLVTAIGSGPLAELVRAELHRAGVRVHDLAADVEGFEINVSVVTVDETGARAVVSLDGGRLADDGNLWPTTLSSNNFGDVGVALLDGHYPSVAEPAARWARATGIPVVLDAGRWKPQFADLLPLADEVVASADFDAPDGQDWRRLAAAAARVTARTHGADPVEVTVDGAVTTVPVPEVEAVAVDTLGAGDVLHGAYALFRARGVDPLWALEAAVGVASERVRTGGVRP